MSAALYNPTILVNSSQAISMARPDHFVILDSGFSNGQKLQNVVSLTSLGGVFVGQMAYPSSMSSDFGMNPIFDLTQGEQLQVGSSTVVAITGRGVPWGSGFYWMIVAPSALFPSFVGESFFISEFGTQTLTSSQQTFNFQNPFPQNSSLFISAQEQPISLVLSSAIATAATNFTVGAPSSATLPITFTYAVVTMKGSVAPNGQSVIPLHSTFIQSALNLWPGTGGITAIPMPGPSSSQYPTVFASLFTKTAFFPVNGTVYNTPVVSNQTQLQATMTGGGTISVETANSFSITNNGNSGFGQNFSIGAVIIGNPLWQGA